MTAGTVLSAVGGIYHVELTDGSTIEAVLRGRLKRDGRADDRIVAGDDVRLTLQDDRWVIAGAEPRRSQLVRRAPGPGRIRPKIIVANIDRLLIVFAAAQPEPNTRMLDRLLVLAESNALEALIVLNKNDLVGEAAAAAWLAPYRAAGYATLLTSVTQDMGIGALRERLCGSRSALSGPSGAGKSSLLNAVQPGLGLRVGAVSEVVNKGKHTTVSALLIPLECGGYVADTPGLREVGLWGVDHSELPHCFPEFRAHLPSCRFSACSHTHEPGCAVRSAVDAGEISSARYDSYARLHAEALGEA